MLVLYLRLSGKCKFNIWASNTLDTADGDIVYSRDSERELNTEILALSPVVIYAGKFLTVELLDVEVGVRNKSLVITNDI